jgi:hypothetical protein
VDNPGRNPYAGSSAALAATTALGLS